MLKPGNNDFYVPTIFYHVFHATCSKHMIHIKEHFGTVLYMVCVIEFQKRGLSRCHMIIKARAIFLLKKYTNICKYFPETPFDQIDYIILAKLSTKGLELREAVQQYNVHIENHLATLI